MHKRPRSILALLLLFLFFSCLSSAAGGAGPVLRTFRIKYMDVKEAEIAAGALLSPEGKITSNARTGTLMVKDHAANLEQIEKLLQEVDTPPRQLRVEVRYMDESELSRLGLRVKWRYTDAHWSVGNFFKSRDFKGSEGVDIRAQLEAGRVESVKKASAFLVVRSGGSGSFYAGESIPYRDWFYFYSRNHGYYRSALRFKEARTGFSVMPVLRGETVSVAITPELSYTTDDGSGSIRFSRLSTIVEARPGEEVVLGGSETDSEAVVTRFFGGLQKSGERRGSLMTLKVTVEK